jgi:hypothetical protein
MFYDNQFVTTSSHVIHESTRWSVQHSQPGGFRATLAFFALVRHIAAKPEACEIVTVSSLPELRRVFEMCGLRLRASSLIFLADPGKTIPADTRIEITMMIGHPFYQFDPSSPFYGREYPG